MYASIKDKSTATIYRPAKSLASTELKTRLYKTKYFRTTKQFEQYKKFYGTSSQYRQNNETPKFEARSVDTSRNNLMHPSYIQPKSFDYTSNLLHTPGITYGIRPGLGKPKQYCDCSKPANDRISTNSIVSALVSIQYLTLICTQHCLKKFRQKSKAKHAHQYGGMWKPSYIPNPSVDNIIIPPKDDVFKYNMSKWQPPVERKVSATFLVADNGRGKYESFENTIQSGGIFTLTTRSSQPLNAHKHKGSDNVMLKQNDIKSIEDVADSNLNHEPNSFDHKNEMLPSKLKANPPGTASLISPTLNTHPAKDMAENKIKNKDLPLDGEGAIQTIDEKSGNDGEDNEPTHASLDVMHVNLSLNLVQENTTAGKEVAMDGEYIDVIS